MKYKWLKAELAGLADDIEKIEHKQGYEDTTNYYGGGFKDPTANVAMEKSGRGSSLEEKRERYRATAQKYFQVIKTFTSEKNDIRILTLRNIGRASWAEIAEELELPMLEVIARHKELEKKLEKI